MTTAATQIETLELLLQEIYDDLLYDEKSDHWPIPLAASESKSFTITNVHVR
jgi:hypothetical protein